MLRRHSSLLRRSSLFAVATFSLASAALLSSTLADEARAQDAAPAGEVTDDGKKEKAAQPAKDPVAEADALMKKRGLKNLKKAVEIYKAELAKKPGDVDLMLKTADALNGVIRVRTNGNSVLIDGTSDTAANKKIFGTLGKESLALAEKVIAKRPKDVKAHAVYTDSYIYASSAYGIIKAAFTGAADKYQANAQRLSKLDKKWDGGLGYMLMGAFYTAAPWPLTDHDKAISFMKKALKVKSKSRRNQYYMGIALYRDGQYAESIPFFEAVPKSPCASLTERDFCGALKREAKRALKAAKENAD